MRLTCVTLALVAAAPVHAQHESAGSHQHAGAVGNVHFAVTGTRAAAGAFDRGIALLHSFEYVDAAIAFRKAAALDPRLALARYGEALTFRHPLWSEEDLAAAHHALDQLATTPAQRLALVPTPRERAYASAVEALFSAAPEPARAQAFADSMRAVAARYPNDAEAKAFTSIALLGAAQFRRDSTRLLLRLDAARLAEQVLAANPEHPGAAHYIIHAYDSPELASRGLQAAERYAAIAPAAGHALHMPSHIFLQLGRWRDVERANVAANASAQRWVRDHHVGAESRDFHALDWLTYALVQQGRIHAARAVLDTVARLIDEARTFTVNDYGVTDLGEATAFYIARDAGVRAALMAPRPHAFDRYTSPVQPANATPALYAFLTRGFSDAARGDSMTSRDNARRMHGFTDTVTAGSLRWYRVMAQDLDAIALAARGDTTGALKLLADATEKERPLLVWTGPFISIPAGELYAQLLFDARNYSAAAEAFTQALAMRKNASGPLLGRARARWAAGDRAGAADDYCSLARNWADADRDLPALAEVRTRSGCKDPRTATSAARVRARRDGPWR